MFYLNVELGALDNRSAAKVVFSIAALLEANEANPYRVQAYRRAAIGLLRLPQPAVHYLDANGELELPWLGSRLRRKLGELVTHGRMHFYDELLAELPHAVRELLAVPGIGPTTAERLAHNGIRGVRGLARAAREGRLQKIHGIGAIRERQLGEAAEALLKEPEVRSRVGIEGPRDNGESGGVAPPLLTPGS